VLRETWVECGITAVNVKFNILKEREKKRRHSWIRHTIMRNEFVVNIPEGAIYGKKAVGRPRLQYSKQVVGNTEADSYTAVKRMACNNSRWKAVN
jgi:hypothetical protein